MPQLPVKPDLWNAKIICHPDSADLIAEKLEEMALSVSVTAPPRQAEAEVDALFDFAPDPEAFNADMALWAGMKGVKMGRVVIDKVADLDWLKKVAADFPPLLLGRWTVFGADHKQNVKTHRHLKLQIDATSAFGTGEHPTTRGCLEMLDRLLKTGRPQNLLDMGCGSGILAMAFAKTYHGKAVAVDIDPLSVMIAKENARQNGLSGCVHVGYSNGTFSAAVQKGAPYDLLMANIFARPLCEMAGALKKLLLPGAHAILSGILTKQANAVITVYRAQGFQLIRRVVIGEWSVLALKYPSGPS